MPETLTPAALTLGLDSLGASRDALDHACRLLSRAESLLVDARRHESVAEVLRLPQEGCPRVLRESLSHHRNRLRRRLDALSLLLREEF